MLGNDILDPGQALGGKIDQDQDPNCQIIRKGDLFLGQSQIQEENLSLDQKKNIRNPNIR